MEIKNNLCRKQILQSFITFYRLIFFLDNNLRLKNYYLNEICDFCRLKRLKNFYFPGFDKKFYKNWKYSQWTNNSNLIKNISKLFPILKSNNNPNFQRS